MRSALLVMGLMVATAPVRAGVASKVIGEAIEFTAKKFGKEVAEEGVERMAGRMTQLAAKHGDEVVVGAFCKVGPRAGQIASQAGEHGGIALRLLAKHGDEAMSLAVSKKSLVSVALYGDDAATALVRHGTVGHTLVDGFGKSGVEALTRVSQQNGRRMAMLAADGALKPELMSVIARHGDRACDFIWRNKGALAVGATLTVFLASPEEFIQGTADLAQTVGESAVKPLATLPRAVASEAAKRVNWNLVLLTMVALLVMVLGRWARLFASLASVALGWSTKRSERKEVRHDNA